MAAADPNISSLCNSVSSLASVITEFSEFQNNHDLAPVDVAVAWNALTHRFVCLSGELTQKLLREGVRNGF